jgi:Family of unknown function (DUF5677)
MNVDQQYSKRFDELLNLFKAALKLSEMTSGKAVASKNIEWSSYIFIKICGHAHAITVLAPKGPTTHPAPETELWDISSIAVLARALIDCYYAMVYITDETASARELDFRLLVWNYHRESRRLEMLELIGSVKPEIVELREEICSIKKSVEAHPKFQVLDTEKKNRARNAKEAFLKSHSDLSIVADIHKNYYKSTYMHLSSYVHSHPFSLMDLSVFKAGDQESLIAMKTILGNVAIYLCCAIRDYCKISNQPLALLGEDVEKLIAEFTYIAKNIYEPTETTL